MKHFVVDGDTGADVYGEASSAEEAMAVASDSFVDGVASAYLGGSIALRDGRRLEKAWIVLPKEWSGSPDPSDPDNYWIDDETGERVSAETGERTKV